jgi:hypothetical protein
MSKHHEIGRTPRVSARQYITTGISGAALVGVGVLLATDPGAPTEATPEVQLASFGSLLAPQPLTPSTTTPWWWLGGGGTDNGGGGLFGASIVPTALVAEIGGGTGFNIFSPIGQGGWLIGNGVDAQAGCVGAACNGGNAGSCSVLAVPVSTAATVGPAGCSSAPAASAAKA